MSCAYDYVCNVIPPVDCILSCFKLSSFKANKIFFWSDLVCFFVRFEAKCLISLWIVRGSGNIAVKEPSGYASNLEP